VRVRVSSTNSQGQLQDLQNSGQRAEQPEWAAGAPRAPPPGRAVARVSIRAIRSELQHGTQDGELESEVSARGRSPLA
jgi:hypothetical protein